VTTPQEYLRRSGGKLACAHPAHRVAEVPNSPADLILPECAGRERWLAARQEGIGGSEVGALIGVSEYETAMSVWNTKMNGGKDLSDVPAVDWGHRLEEVVAQKTAEMVGVTSRFAGGLWADRLRPHLRVTPDRLACKGRSWRSIGVIECKTAGDDEGWESGTITPHGGGTGSAPLSYQAQVQWQLGILGLPVGWLGCLVLGRERQFFVVEIGFNREWFAEMAHAADVFWERNIVGDEMPLHDLRHPKTEELLKLLHPTVVQKAVQLPPEAESMLAEYRAVKKRYEDAEQDFTALKNFFRMWVGDAGAGYLGEKKVVSYPEISKSGIDVKKLRAEYPEVAEKVTRKSFYRSMTIRPPKDL
jgi:putative phage-type endonuclease